MQGGVVVGVGGGEGERGVESGAAEANVEELEGLRGGQKVGMRGDVIGVGVGYEGEIPWIAWVEPEVVVWKVDAALLEDLDHVGRRSIDTFGGCGVVLGRSMKRVVCGLCGLFLAVFLASPVVAGVREPARRLEKAEALPLALDDGIRFVKTKHFLNDRNLNTAGNVNRMLTFERLHRNYGAISNADLRERYGNYYTFFWKTDRAADLTVRFEYRLEKLGNYVQAMERNYKGAKGSVETSFEVIGDEHLQDGRVTAWRVVIIEDGRVVALNQSFLWN